MQAMAGDRDQGAAAAAVPDWKRFTVGENRCVPANRGSGPCPRNKAETALANQGDWKVDVGRFLGLHPDGQNLVRGWIEKAAKSKPGDEFEAFIYAWIGLNGWASCCCAEDRDNAQLHMMTLDDRLTRNYARITRDVAVRDAAERFASYWPIFRVSDLDESIRRNRPNHGSRADVVAYYDKSNAQAQRSPECHLNHPGQIKADWSHTLQALYRVRCNLFHGQKSGAGKEDRDIVVAAAGVLIPIAESVLSLH
jgi:hypothetical protein